MGHLRLVVAMIGMMSVVESFSTVTRMNSFVNLNGQKENIMPSSRLTTIRKMSSVEEDNEDRKIQAAKLEERTIEIESTKDDEEKEVSAGAKVNTVNERLMKELEEAQEKEKYGNKGKKGKFEFRYAPERTEEERLAALEEARNLNGINPLICIGGAIFAGVVSAALWSATGYIGEVFATHPVETDFYTIQRLAGVFRNVVIGIVSLASGFFGVTGLGIFLLGIRVAYGVLTGELDPTPIVNSKSSKEQPQILNIWEFMTGSNKRRSKDGGKRDNPFL